MFQRFAILEKNSCSYTIFLSFLLYWLENNEQKEKNGNKCAHWILYEIVLKFVELHRNFKNASHIVIRKMNEGKFETEELPQPKISLKFQSNEEVAIS